MKSMDCERSRTLKQVTAKRTTALLDRSHVYWVSESDFMGGCWHVFVNPDGSGWMFNLFSEEQFRELFE